MKPMPEEPFDRAVRVVGDACAGMRSTWLRPEAFFVARSGVLTLAYSGFPPSMVALKDRLERALDLPAERPGSRWPKTTLAALRDGDVLTPDDVVRLKQATARAGTCLLRTVRPLSVDRIDLVELHDRAMERIGRVQGFDLSAPAEEGAVDSRSRAAVNAVLAQWRREGLPRYVPDLFRGGFRESHYRSPHRELSLVIPVAGRVPCLDAFVAAVEAHLPGRYAWIRPSVLHVTVRTLGDLDAADDAEPAAGDGR